MSERFTLCASVLLPALLLGGCRSPAPEEDRTTVHSERRPAVGEAEPCGPAPAEARARPTGLVKFSVKDADLETEVLPIFYEQAGVRITWNGTPRKVSVRFTQPVRWEAALNMVCRFTRTHACRDYKGLVVLKDGWGGDLAVDDSIHVQRGSGSRPAASPRSSAPTRVPVRRTIRRG